MERINNGKGQVFVIAAVLFSSITVILFITTADILPEEPKDTVKQFYENTFNEAPEKVNQALKDNYSIKNVRNNLYSYSRFVDRSSTSKGVEFGASYFIVLPQKGKGVYINYRDQAENIKLRISGNGWDNTTVQSNQYLEKSFSPGKTDFRLIISDRDIDQKFTASSPRMFTMMKVTAQNQIWINSELN